MSVELDVFELSMPVRGHDFAPGFTRELQLSLNLDLDAPYLTLVRVHLLSMSDTKLWSNVSCTTISEVFHFSSVSAFYFRHLVLLLLECARRQLVQGSLLDAFVHLFPDRMDLSL